MLLKLHSVRTQVDNCNLKKQLEGKINVVKSDLGLSPECITCWGSRQKRTCAWICVYNLSLAAMPSSLAVHKS